MTDRRAFLGDGPRPWVLCITSISESRLLTELGLPRVEQNQILGLQVRRAAGVISGGVWLSGQQLSNRAIVRLAANPPPQVGKMQRYTSRRLVRAAVRPHTLSMTTRHAKVLRSISCSQLRPFPLGLRLSGNNMSPLPCWLSGSQSVAYAIGNRTQGRTVASSTASSPHPQRQAQHEQKRRGDAASSCFVQHLPRVHVKAGHDAARPVQSRDGS
jgi:hypothetical protein